MIVSILTLANLGPEFTLVAGNPPKLRLNVDGATLSVGPTGIVSVIGGTPAPAPAPAPSPSLTAPQSIAEASRFFSQASVGQTSSEIAALQSTTYDAWITSQIAMPRSQNHIDWLNARGFFSSPEFSSEFPSGTIDSIWRKYYSSPDTLRMRTTLAWSELFSTSLTAGGSWSNASGAHFIDTLEANAFGNFKDMLSAVTYTYHMGRWLTFLGNQASNGITHPDENYAREIMQLFTIGLFMLNTDGSQVLVGGQPVSTYVQADITQIARIFTGLNPDYSATPDWVRTTAATVSTDAYVNFDSGQKTFMGTSIPATAQDAPSVTNGINYFINFLFNHQNVGPFVGKFLIQRLVTSNPSAAYVGRVAAKFNNNGSGVRGDMATVIRTILLDVEARSATLINSTVGAKLREPMVTLMHLMRLLKVSSGDGNWAGQNTIAVDSTNLNRYLSQSPHYASSVFNFFRPGYVPSGSNLGAQGYVAPEFQIMNETTIPRMLNYFYGILTGVYFPELTLDYSDFTAIATNTNGLLLKINNELAGGQIDSAATATIATAINSMPSATGDDQLNRVKAAFYLTLASPSFFSQR